LFLRFVIWNKINEAIFKGKRVEAVLLIKKLEVAVVETITSRKLKCSESWSLHGVDYRRSLNIIRFGFFPAIIIGIWLYNFLSNCNFSLLELHF
jgi:hypothetical protein